ncbi:RHS repeat-associated core domain-containing protein [Desulfosediminicola ganghwensis]|uniref:RHS repeat-associated core domain-containing protein n=1 Tax=Desulfosediminicola ganghwensis TaxID=2569540 RepID=UPI0010AD23F9|nr:RHS repeat-associated core domain-containing protein [Desulfosediminicola ganghwensis]
MKWFSLNDAYIHRLLKNLGGFLMKRWLVIILVCIGVALSFVSLSYAEEGSDDPGGGGECQGGSHGCDGGDDGPSPQEEADSEAASHNAAANAAQDAAESARAEMDSARNELESAARATSRSYSDAAQARDSVSRNNDDSGNALGNANNNVNSAEGLEEQQAEAAAGTNAAAEKDNTATQGPQVNCPVVVASGIECFRTIDFSYKALNEQILVQRTYRSNLNEKESSFGLGWAFNYDTKLVVGRKPFIKDREILTANLNEETIELQALVNEKLESSSLLLQSIEVSVADAHLHASKVKELEAKIAALAQIIEEKSAIAQAAADAATAAASRGTSKGRASAASARAIAAETQLESDLALADAVRAAEAVETAEQEVAATEQAFQESSDLVEQITQKKILVDHAAARIAAHAVEAEAEARLEEKLFPNDPYPTDPSVYFGRGFVKVIEADSTPVLFQEQEEGVYLPVSDNSSYTSTVYHKPNGYSLITQHGYETFYAKTGTGVTELASMVDTNGNTTHFERIGDSFTITDPVGRKTVATYNRNDHIQQIVDPQGNLYAYAYENDLLTRYIDPLGYVWKYGYDENNRLISRADPQGNVYQYAYDENGRVVQEIDKAGYVISYDYDPDNQVTVETDRKGNQRYFYYNDAHRLERLVQPDGATIFFTYDERNNVSSKTDENGITTYLTYNEFNDVISVTDGLGGVTNITYEQKFNKVASVTDPLGRTRYFDYDIHGNLTTITHPDGATRSIVYDAQGLPVSVIDENGNPTELFYDMYGQLSDVRNPDGTAKSLMADILGRITSATDENGNTTQYQYNPVGKVVRAVDPLGAETLIEYDSRRKIIKRTNAKGQSYLYSYTARGNLAQITDPMGYSEYREYDESEKLSMLTYPNGTGVAYAYDSRENLVAETTLPSNRETLYFYDDKKQKIAVNDANGNTTSYVYDSLGRKVSTNDAEGNTITSVYDAVGNLLELIDANGNPINYEYDSRDRLVYETDAIGNVTAYQYDGVGNVISKVKPDGSAINNSYDARSRLMQVSYPDGTTKEYGYDGVGNMTYIANQETEEVREYDPLGRLLLTSDAYNGQIDYEYDILGNRVRMVDPDNGVMQYRYDVNNRLTSFIDPEGKKTTYQYDSMGRVVSKTMPNGVTTEKVYDDENRLVRIESYSRKNGVISSFAYTHDAVGNRTSVQEEDAGVTTYEYDNIYQLTKVNYPLREGIVIAGPKNAGSEKGKGKKIGQTSEEYLTFESFLYDPAGNRLSMTNDVETISYQHNAANQMVRAGETLFSYDANGNRISETTGEGATYFSYTYDDMLAQVDNPDGESTAYGYDALSRRIYKVDQEGDTTSYLYDGLEVLQEVSGQNSQKITAYYRANGQIITRQEYNVSQGYNGAYQNRPEGLQIFYTYDALGSLASISKHNGQLESRYRYSVYGSLLQGDMSDNVYGFTGKRFDVENGTYHFHFRQYDPVNGVWTTKDPIGVFGGVNLYGYLGNDPVNWIDWLGLHSFEDQPQGATAITSCHASERGETPRATFGVSGTIATATTSIDQTSGMTDSHSTSHAGWSVDVTIGEKGTTEAGVGARHIGVGANFDKEGNLVGVSGHAGYSWPPSLVYGSVSSEEEPSAKEGCE